MRILVTGGAGFIGSAFVHLILDRYAEDQVVTLDALTYAGNLNNLESISSPERHRFVEGDICDVELVDGLIRECDAVVNFAAETHVDRSLLGSHSFLRTNIEGVSVLLDGSRKYGKRLVQVSTDEVYGDIEPGRYSTESDALRPRSPYAASKASAELMCGAHAASFGTDVVITRGCNTVGPRQYPEKLIPLFITSALRDEPLPVYGDGLQQRDWIYVDDHAAGIDVVMRKGQSGEVYNVGASNRTANIDVVNVLLGLLGKSESLIVHVPDRPGHDRRYALDHTKIERDLGWKATRNLQSALASTIEWYLSNSEWWSNIRDASPEFRNYYVQQYGWRFGQSGYRKANP